MSTEVFNTHELQAAAAHAQIASPTAAGKHALESLFLTPDSPRKFKLTDGREVVICRPAKATSLMIARVLGKDSTNPVLANIYRALLYVVSINDKVIPPRTQRADFDSVADMLGDDALEELIGEVYATQIAAQAEDPEEETLKNS